MAKVKKAEGKRASKPAAKKPAKASVKPKKSTAKSGTKTKNKPVAAKKAKPAAAKVLSVNKPAKTKTRSAPASKAEKNKPAPAKVKATEKAAPKAAEKAAAAKPRRRKIIPISTAQPKPTPQTPVAKLAAIKTQQAATLRRPLPARPEVMPQKPGTSTVQGRTRYSDKELAEFRKIILEKLQQAKNDLNYLQEQIGQKGDGDAGISETTFASSDDGSTSMEREYLVQMASRLRKYIDHLDKALVRIENKTYGICRVTGKLIEKERLLAVPHATLSMEGKRLESHAPQPQEGG